MKFRWKENGPQPKIEADVFGNIVEQIAGDRPPLNVPPEEIVDAARDPSNPIHELFTWNDQVAAEGYRRQQARRYLGLLEVVHVELKEGRGGTSSRAFFSVKVDGKRGYMSRDNVLSSSDLRLQVMNDAARELESYLTKFGGVLNMGGTYVPRLRTIVAEMKAEADQLLQAASRKPRTRKRDPQGETINVV